MKLLYELKINSNKSNVVFAWQNFKETYLAAVSDSNIIKIINRFGKIVNEFDLGDEVKEICWSPNGAFLTAILKNNSTLFIWSESNNNKYNVDSGFKESLNCIGWSQDSTMIACGSTKGNLLIFNVLSKKKTSILGKHMKSITYAVWDSDNVLALACQDNKISISNMEGCSLQELNLGYSAKNLKFSQMKKTGNLHEPHSTLSLIANKRVIYLININTKEVPIEIVFQEKYGKIVDYEWFGDGYIVVAFITGTIVVLSSHMKEIYKEISKVTFFEGKKLTSFSACHKSNRIAVSSNERVEILSMKDVRGLDHSVESKKDFTIQSLEWSSNGSYLTLGGSNGIITVYLYKLPKIYSKNKSKIAFMSSITEITVVDMESQKGITSFEVALEPSFLELNNSLIAVGINNKVIFHSLADKDSPVVMEIDYFDEIEKLRINDVFAAALSGGRLKLSKINSKRDFIEQTFSITEIVDFYITPDFLIYYTRKCIFYYSLTKMSNSITIPVEASITSLFMSIDTYYTILCTTSSSQLIRPFKECVKIIEDFIFPCEHVVWTTVDNAVVFLGCNKTEMAVYVISENFGDFKINLISKFKRKNMNIPIHFDKLTIISLTVTGTLERETLAELDEFIKDKTVKRSDLALKGESECSFEENQQIITKLVENGKIMEALYYAKKVGDIKTVLVLEPLLGLTDKFLISGYLMMFLNKYDQAQEYFLKSSDPTAALEMRVDLMHWNEAMLLAKSFKSEYSGFIAYEYSQQMELAGNYSEAINYYKIVIYDFKDSEYVENAKAGLARSLLKNKEFESGAKIASKIKYPELQISCANILEEFSIWKDAGLLYEAAGEHDLAAKVYLNGDLWNKLEKIKDKITSKPILCKLGEKLEEKKEFRDAASVFERAGEFVRSITILLNELNDAENAIKIARKSNLDEAVQIIAEFFEKIGDFKTAIRFFVKIGYSREALRLAQTHYELEFYISLIDKTESVELHCEIGNHFLEQNNPIMAAKHFRLCKKFNKALSILLDNLTPQTMDFAVEIIGETDDVNLRGKLLNVIEKYNNQKLLIQLHINTKNYTEAVNISKCMANEQIKAGNYSLAMEYFLEAAIPLNKLNHVLPDDFMNDISILQSYNLAKYYMKHNKELTSNLLIRVIENIDKFSTHAVLILKTTLVECYRSGLGDYVSRVYKMLKNPQYYYLLDEKSKMQIENIMTKRIVENKEDTISPCPFCNFLLPSMKLTCGRCKKFIPFCVASGRHVVRDEWTRCPNCYFSANLKEFENFVKFEQKCPICSFHVSDIKMSPPSCY